MTIVIALAVFLAVSFVGWWIGERFGTLWLVGFVVALITGTRILFG